MRLTFVTPSGPAPIGGVSALYEFANGLARRGHEIRLLHLAMWGREVGSLDDLDRFRFEPSIVHFFPGDAPESVPDSDLVFGTGAPARLGLPVLLVQGIDMLHEHLERRAFRTPCLKICIASWLVDVGDRYGVAPQQMEVVPMGIDHDRYRVTVPLGERHPQVAMLHSTHTAKGWDVGLEALRQIRRQVPDVRVVAFGTAPPVEPAPPWLEFFLDPDPEVLVETIYNRSQVFIQSSDYEGFGFTAVEAMACGAALVTTDNGGSRDYAVHGETALVAPPATRRRWPPRATLLEDDPLRLRIAGAGERAVRRFDWDLGAEMLEGHLLRYLENPAPYQEPPGPEKPVSPLLSPRPDR